MNNHQKGYHLNKAIMRTIENQGCLTTEQIYSLFYANKKTGMRMAQRKLLILHQSGRLRRGKEDFTQPYYYYLEKRPRQLEHLLGVNWIYAWLQRQKRDWEEIHSFDREADYGLVRSDAFVTIKNKVTGGFKFMFVEMDIAESENKFRKVEQYNQLYQSDRYLSSWWVPLASGFPKILIVTTTPGRLKGIQRQIEANNCADLEFEVHLLEDIRRACLC